MEVPEDDVEELGPLSDLLYGERAYTVFGFEVPTEESAEYIRTTPREYDPHNHSF